MMKAYLDRLQLGRGPQEDASEKRLQRVISQSRAEATAGVLGRLSAQSSDPSEEDVTQPLYGEEAYRSSPEADA